MRSPIICILLVMHAPFMYCCQGPQHDDPARLIFDTQDSPCHKKVDGQQQYMRNEWKKNRTHHNQYVTITGASTVKPNVTSQKNFKSFLKNCVIDPDYDSDGSYCGSPDLHGQ